MIANLVRAVARCWPNPKLRAAYDKAKADIVVRDSRIAALHRRLDDCDGWICIPANDLRAKLKAVSTDWSRLKTALAAMEKDLGAERERNRVLSRQLAAELSKPVTLAGKPAVLTPAQREDAADDAAWKRAQDGVADQ